MLAERESYGKYINTADFVEKRYVVGVIGVDSIQYKNYWVKD